MVGNGEYMRRWAFYCTKLSNYYAVYLYSQTFNLTTTRPMPYIHCWGYVLYSTKLSVKVGISFFFKSQNTAENIHSEPLV